MRYADVVSSLALFLSLGGVSYAVTQIDDNSVSSRHVVNGSLTGLDIKTGSVTSSDIKDGSLSAADVLGGLPGITYFKYRDPDVNLGPATTTVLTDRVGKGDYYVTAQVIFTGPAGSPYRVQCNALYGEGNNPPAVGFGTASGTFPNVNATPLESVEISGVFEAKEDNTLLRVGCVAVTNGATVVLQNARMMATQLRDLQIEPEG